MFRIDVDCRIEYYFAYVDQYVNFTCWRHKLNNSPKVLMIKLLVDIKILEFIKKKTKQKMYWFEILEFLQISNATFNSISVILRQPVLLVEETGLTTLVVNGTDCIGSYKSNYHTTTTVPYKFQLK